METINKDGIQVSQQTANWVKLVYEFEDFYSKVIDAYRSQHGGDDKGYKIFKEEMESVLLEVSSRLDKKLTDTILDIISSKENKMII